LVRREVGDAAEHDGGKGQENQVILGELEDVGRAQAGAEDVEPEKREQRAAGKRESEPVRESTSQEEHSGENECAE
jgi:hypothetical protein